MGWSWFTRVALQLDECDRCNFDLNSLRCTDDEVKSRRVFFFGESFSFCGWNSRFLCGKTIIFEYRRYQQRIEQMPTKPQPSVNTTKGVDIHSARVYDCVPIRGKVKKMTVIQAIWTACLIAIELQPFGMFSYPITSHPSMSAHCFAWQYLWPLFGLLLFVLLIGLLLFRSHSLGVHSKCIPARIFFVKQNRILFILCAHQ